MTAHPPTITIDQCRDHACTLTAAPQHGIGRAGAHALAPPGHDRPEPPDLAVDDAGLIGYSSEVRPCAGFPGVAAPDDPRLRTDVATIVARQGWQIVSWDPWSMQRSNALLGGLRPRIRCATLSDLERLWAWIIAGGRIDAWILSMLGLPTHAMHP